MLDNQISCSFHMEANMIAQIRSGTSPAERLKMWRHFQNNWGELSSALWRGHNTEQPFELFKMGLSEFIDKPTFGDFGAVFDLPYEVRHRGWHIGDGKFPYRPSLVRFCETLSYWEIPAVRLLSYILCTKLRASDDSVIYSFRLETGDSPSAIMFDDIGQLHLTWIGDTFLLDATILLDHDV